MKVCVSSRIVYSGDWSKIKEILDRLGLDSYFPKKEDFKGKDEAESLDLMKEITNRYYGYIDDSDLLYVNARDGDVSRAVSCEIGYAKAKGLKVVSSEEIKELEVRAMIEEVVPIEELKNYLETVNVN